jgi:hypothetical protein
MKDCPLGFDLFDEFSSLKGRFQRRCRSFYQGYCGVICFDGFGGIACVVQIVAHAVEISYGGRSNDGNNWYHDCAYS